ncbi:ABC transporter ATP-binding protein [Succinimonas amylolytica]|uniref:ABC transporter ATP-binding protein n=1 Tax=Succinimonas amylolytica TaxID=83769 RepID=UPI000379C0A9|nr:ABC transporter ATP-binding protein [Succinimonas amylolytica]
MTSFFLKYWRCSLLSVIFMILEVSADLTLPGIMAGIVDNAILGGPEHLPPDISQVISAGLLMTGVMLGGLLAGLLSAVFANLFSMRGGNLIRKALFARIAGFSFPDYDRFSAGSLITRTTSDIVGIQNMTAQLIRGAVRALMFLVAGSAALLALSPDFGMTLLFALPLIIIETAYILRKSRPLFEELQHRTDLVNQTAREGLIGLTTIKAFARENYENRRFSLVNSDLARSRYRSLILLSFMHPLMNIILNLAIVGLIWIGAVQAADGLAAPGTVMAGVTYLSQILNGLLMLALIFQNVTRGLASWDRVSEVLNTEPALRDGTAAGGPESGTVSFRDVSFRYPGQKEDALSGITLDIHAGETIGITGSTGSGKSALLQLIPRFYDTTSGTVAVDGTDVRDWQIRELRARVGVAFQKTPVFTKTLRDNIRAGNPAATEEEVLRAAANAAASDFISEKPEAYDTVPGAGGTGLSGGQKQRIQLARVFCQSHEIIILDDALSALDFRTEAAVLNSIRREYSGNTVIIVSQRISTLRNADRILVLDAGRIAGTGTHEELLGTCPVYQELFRTQNGGLSGDSTGQGEQI